MDHMFDLGKKLFTKIHKRKYHAHHNAEIHFMAREIDDWSPKGIQSVAELTAWLLLLYSLSSPV